MDKLRDKEVQIHEIDYEHLIYCFKSYPIGGELHVTITKNSRGYKIQMLDYDPCDDEDMSCKIVDMLTDLDGVINVIEHGHCIFTTANAETVKWIVSFIGVKISDIAEHVME
jgi:hypothetical protein